MKKSPITVVIPVKNRLNELVEAINSLKSQTSLPDELIIIDDESDVEVKLNYLPICDFKIIIVRNEFNIGGASSINKGVLLAKNKIVCVLDSDDIYYRNYIEDVYGAWLELGFGRTAIVAVGFDWCDECFNPYKSQIARDFIGRDDLLRCGNIVGGSSVLSFDRDVFLEFGGYPDLRGSFDYGMMLNLTRHSPIRVLNKVLVGYRSPSTATTSTVTKSPRRQIKALFTILNGLSDKEKELAKNNIATLVAGHLAKGQKIKTSKKIINWLLFKRGCLNYAIVKIFILNIIGSNNYYATIKMFALLRAKFKKI